MKITCEDNMELMARYPDGYFDLAIVDPPYRDANENDMMQHNRNVVKKGRLKDWNNKPQESYFNELFRVSKNQIIWGANNFNLPNYKGFIVWRKLTISENFNYSMCELAYLSNGLSTISKMYSQAPQQKNRIHPTQKPIQLYEWLLMNYANKGDKILDTHLGSGSIAIACHNLGFDLTACELDPDYYEAAMKRIEQHKSQQRLF